MNECPNRYTTKPLQRRSWINIDLPSSYRCKQCVFDGGLEKVEWRSFVPRLPAVDDDVVVEVRWTDVWSRMTVAFIQLRLQIFALWHVWMQRKLAVP